MKRARKIGFFLICKSFGAGWGWGWSATSDVGGRGIRECGRGSICSLSSLYWVRAAAHSQSRNLGQVTEPKASSPLSVSQGQGLPDLGTTAIQKQHSGVLCSPSNPETAQSGLASQLQALAPPMGWPGVSLLGAEGFSGQMSHREELWVKRGWMNALPGSHHTPSLAPALRAGLWVLGCGLLCLPLLPVSPSLK